MNKLKAGYKTSKIRELEQDKMFIQKTKTSIYQLNRIFFSMSSGLFMLIGLANLVPLLLSTFGINAKLVTLTEICLWSFVATFGFLTFRMFARLKDTQGWLDKIETKIAKLTNKKS
jgi:uncharacterized membrane protein